MIFNDLSDG